MKKVTYLFMLLSVLILAFSSCTKRDVDLNNLDTQLEADMALALPVGAASVTLGDLLEIGRLSEYFQISNDTIFYLYDDTISAEFHPIDLKQYITTTTKSMPIKSHWPTSMPSIDVLGGFLPAGIPLELTYDMPIKLNGINSNTASERIDYAEIDSACFTTVLYEYDLASLKFSDIKSLTMYLPTSTFALYNEIPVGDNYVIDIPLTGQDYGKPIPIYIKNFRLNLQNADKSVNDNFVLSFKFNIQSTNNVPISDVSAINYQMEVNFINYSVIYGFFKPSKLVSDTNEFSLFENLGSWDNFTQFRLPIAEPKVQVEVSTTVGVPLMFIIHHLKAYSKDNPSDIKAATFDGSPEDRWDMPEYVKVTDPLGTVAKNYRTYDNGPRGDLDKLFEIRPDIISYAYETIISPTHSEITQHRLEPNTNIYVHTRITVPFVFNPDVEIEYKDTISDVSIDRFSIDSITKRVDQIESIEAASLKLILTTENWIPFNLKAHFKFYDSANQLLDIKLQDGESDAITIPGPTTNNFYLGSGKIVSSPCDTTFTWTVDNEELKRLSQVDHIVYDVSLGDNTVACDAYASSKLKLHLSLSADVTAILDPLKKENK